MRAAIEVLTPNEDRRTGKAQANSAYNRSTANFWRIAWIVLTLKIDPHAKSTPAAVERQMFRLWDVTRKARLKRQDEFEAVAALRDWAGRINNESMQWLQPWELPLSETAIRNALKRFG